MDQVCWDGYLDSFASNRFCSHTSEMAQTWSLASAASRSVDGMECALQNGRSPIDKWLRAMGRALEKAKVGEKGSQRRRTDSKYLGMSRGIQDGGSGRRHTTWHTRGCQVQPDWAQTVGIYGLVVSV